MRAAFIRFLTPDPRSTALSAVAMLLMFGSGCSLVPTWDDMRSAGTYVKDHVTGKARQDRMNKMYAEARLVERRKDYANAEALYRELLKEEPNSRDCHHRLGVIAAQQGKHDQAHACYQQALQCSTPTPDLWSDVGFCFYLQNKLPEAEQALQQALTLDPKHRAALNNLAMVVGEQGRIDEAYELFCRGNNEAEAEQNIGFLCAACGELERAQQHFSRALNINPELRPAAEALIQVTQSMQRRQDYLAQQGAAPNEEHPVASPGAPTRGTQVDPNVVPAGGAAADAGGVRQAAAQSIDGGQRRLIEYYTAPPRRTAPASAPTEAGAVQQASATQTTSAGRQPAPNTPPASFGNPAVPQPAPAIPGQMPQTLTPPGAISFPMLPQPQYLQPSNIAPRQSLDQTFSGMSPANPSIGAYPSMTGATVDSRR